jgi:hypothetical protein
MLEHIGFDVRPRGLIGGVFGLSANEKADGYYAQSDAPAHEMAPCEKEEAKKSGAKKWQSGFACKVIFQGE